MTEREELAEKFNTSEQYVRFWGELTAEQQRQASVVFLGNDDSWAYCVGVNDSVLMRRKRKKGGQ